MAFYSGTVSADQLFPTLIDHVTAVHPGADAPWWINESSIQSDGAFISRGSTGSERIVVILRPQTEGQSILVGYAKDYTPGLVNTAGAFQDSDTQEMRYFSSVQNPAVDVTYHLSVTPDRIILHLQGDKLVSSWQNTVVYIGMPSRYDLYDKKCIVRSASENNTPNGSLRVLEDSVGITHQSYNWYYVNSPGNPSWGNHFFIETLHFGLAGEGLRGELDGIYGSHNDGLIDGDIIEVNGIEYLVIKRLSNGNNGFPRATLLMRKE